MAIGLCKDVAVQPSIKGLLNPLISCNIFLNTKSTKKYQYQYFLSGPVSNAKHL